MKSNQFEKGIPKHCKGEISTTTSGYLDLCGSTAKELGEATVRGLRAYGKMCKGISRSDTK